MSNTSDGVRHTHCFCIDVFPVSGGSIINAGITKPHKKCCMCGQMTLSQVIGGLTS